jgi:hypothetical protein
MFPRADGSRLERDATWPRAAGVSFDAVKRFERGGTVKPRTVEAIQRTLTNAGVIFIDANDGGPGARLG